MQTVVTGYKPVQKALCQEVEWVISQREGQWFASQLLQSVEVCVGKILAPEASIGVSVCEYWCSVTEKKHLYECV